MKSNHVVRVSPVHVSMIVFLRNVFFELEECFFLSWRNVVFFLSLNCSRNVLSVSCNDF